VALSVASPALIATANGSPELTSSTKLERDDVPAHILQVARHAAVSATGGSASSGSNASGNATPSPVVPDPSDPVSSAEPTANSPVEDLNWMNSLGLQVSQTSGQTQTILPGLVIPLTGQFSLTKDSAEHPVVPILPSGSGATRAGNPYFSTIVAGRAEPDFPVNFRSLVLSRPTRAQPVSDSLADSEKEELAPESASIESERLAADETASGFREPQHGLAVDAPGGPGLAWGAWTNGGEQGTPMDRDGQAELGEVVPLVASRRVTIGQPHPGDPAAAGHQVTVRAVAAVAAGLVLPNVLIIGSGVARKRREGVQARWTWRPHGQRLARASRIKPEPRLSACL
jgi:hypothetical protein